MRHNVYGSHLSRNKNQRTALFKSLVQSLILSESIQTTEAKAKAIKGLVDKIINQAKSPSTRRLVEQFLVKKSVQDKLVKELLPRLQDRNSGYTNLVRMGVRPGDGASVMKVSLILSEVKKTAPAKASVDKEAKTAKGEKDVKEEVKEEKK